MHQTLGGVAGPAKVVLQHADQHDPWRNTKHRPGIRNGRDAILCDLGDKRDWHGEGGRRGIKDTHAVIGAAYRLIGLAAVLLFQLPPLSQLTMSDHDDEDYFLPLEDQRVFGAGIRRKRVPFVRSSEHELSTTGPARPSSTPSSGTSVADAYLSIVLKSKKTAPSSALTCEEAPFAPHTHSAPPSPDAAVPSNPPTTRHCDVCNLPLSEPQSSDSTTSTSSNRPHEASLAHQVCLTHSHPPSHLDRSRAGLRYLSTYGWNPDSRLGLGAPGREGIREPLKGRIKNDTAGLGVGLDADGDRIRAPPPPPKKVQKLNAKQVRKESVEAQRRADKMRNMFFQSDDVLKYLGETG